MIILWWYSLLLFIDCWTLPFLDMVSQGVGGDSSRTMWRSYAGMMMGESVTLTQQVSTIIRQNHCITTPTPTKNNFIFTPPPLILLLMLLPSLLPSHHRNDKFHTKYWMLNWLHDKASDIFCSKQLNMTFMRQTGSCSTCTLLWSLPEHFRHLRDIFSSSKDPAV